jgi:hypothetical protein
MFAHDRSLSIEEASAVLAVIGMEQEACHALVRLKHSDRETAFGGRGHSEESVGAPCDRDLYRFLLPAMTY